MGTSLGTSTRGVPLLVDGLTKRFGPVLAVEDLTFDVSPGRVTGFLGPNGSGKTTTLRCLLGLVNPSSGHTRVGASPYRELSHPMQVVGAALESSNFHPARSARNHLRIQCTAAGIDQARADETLELVGLAESARRRVAEFSTGMRQRLSLAGALLGDPVVLVLDEPTNGLDPAGIAWLRGFLRAYAATGRTVLVASHALAEVSATVDDVVIISRGQLVHSGPLEGLLAQTAPGVFVTSPQAEVLANAVAAEHPSVAIERIAPDHLRLFDIEPREVGRIAFAHSLELHELSQSRIDLEAVFLKLTARHANQAEQL